MSSYTRILESVVKRTARQRCEETLACKPGVPGNMFGREIMLVEFAAIKERPRLCPGSRGGNRIRRLGAARTSDWHYSAVGFNGCFSLSLQPLPQSLLRY